MNIYVQDGQKYIYITKDELEELEWDEYRLLELSVEDSTTRGVSIPLAPGWLIGPSNVAASKFRYGKERMGSREAYKPDITIVTALFDGRMTGVPHTTGVYDTEYVEKLYRGFERNLTIPFDFICLVDKNYIFQEDIKAIRFKRSVDQYGWMSLMEMYRPEICEGIRLTVGLDTIITGPVDDILQAQVSKLAVCTDPMYTDQICNAITLSTPEFCEEFWGMWEGNEAKLIPDSKLVFENAPPAPSEMVLMRKYYGDSPCIDKVFPNRILSYKIHVKQSELPIDKLEGPMHDTYDRRLKLIEQSSIIYFHGWPKPHNIARQRWVQENWF